MPRISKRLVDRLEPDARQKIEWDTELKGFGVVVRPSGVHSYVFSYRNALARKRMITIGKLGTLTPDEARRKASELRLAVLNGRDPLSEKSQVRNAETIGQLLDDYLSSKSFKDKAASTRSIDKGRIEAHLRPLLGDVPLLSLDLRSVERAFEAISEGKTAKDEPSGRARGRRRITGGEGTARMSIRLLRTILGWGLRAGRVPESSVLAARHVDIGRDGRRHLIIEDQDAYRRLWETLERLTNPDQLKPGERLVRQPVADAIKMIVVTGARRSEIVNLKWSQVDLKNGTLNLSASSHKTGRKTGDARVIVLPRVAHEIIAKQVVGNGDALVFRPENGGQRIDISKPWRKIRVAAQLPDGVGLHGLRHSLASHMAMSGAEAAEIMTVLGHKDITTSQRYIHWAHDRRQELAERAAATTGIGLPGLSDGNEPSQ